MTQLPSTTHDVRHFVFVEHPDGSLQEVPIECRRCGQGDLEFCNVELSPTGQPIAFDAACRWCEAVTHYKFPGGRDIQRVTRRRSRAEATAVWLFNEINPRNPEFESEDRRSEEYFRRHMEWACDFFRETLIETCDEGPHAIEKCSFNGELSPSR